jgi:hypothetical protein
MLVEIPELDAADETALQCVESLAYAHSRGAHYVVATKRALAPFVAALGGRFAGILNAIAASYAQSGELRRHLPFRVRVEPRHEAGVQCISDGDSALFLVPAGYFVEPSRVSPSRLVCEDNTDATVIAAAADAHFSRTALTRVGRFALHSFGGGGSSLADQYLAHAQLGPAVAVVDSDRDMSDGALGGTADAVLRAHASSVEGRNVGRPVVLRVRELENLIPAKVMRDMLTSADSREYQERVEMISRSLISESARYADLKSGIPCSMAALLGLPSCSKCQSRGQRETDCAAIAIQGLGVAFLQRMAKLVSTQTARKVGEALFSQSIAAWQVDEWKAIAKIVAAFAFAAKPMRV